MKGKNDDDHLTRYLNAMSAIYTNLLGVSITEMRYIGEYDNGNLKKQMSHLACSSGGLFALTAMNVPERKLDQYRETFDMNVVKMLATEITQTCRESYTRNPTRLGPEVFGFDNPMFGEREPFAKVRNFALRPELAESYFYLWRMTHDRVYKKWAWELVEALDKYCRTENGFSGLRDVTVTDSIKDDIQPSYFLAETLKYLYLIFSDDDVISLDEYVFNTEGHPFSLND